MGLLVDADAALRTWLRDVVPAAEVAPEPPEDPPASATVSVVLLDVEPTVPVARDPHQRATKVIRLRYLLCADAADAEDSLPLLDAVLAAALETTALPGGHPMELDLRAPAPAVWLALGRRARPCITVRIDVVHVREPDVVPYVREPLRVVGTTIRSLTGRLLDPTGSPIAGAIVSLTATGVGDRTSSSGEFTFSTVPAGAGPVQLGVRAKGRHFTVEVDPSDGEPIVVRCDPLEA